METKLVNSLGFELNTQPVLYNYQGELIKSSKHQIITRSDNGKVLSVMGSNYYPLLVSHFEETTQNLSKLSEYPIVGYQELNDGKVILSFLQNTKKPEVADFPIEEYIVIGSSADGSKPFFIGTSTVLIRCTNSFSLINKMGSVKHTESAPLKIEQLYSYFSDFIFGRNQLYSSFERMMNKKVTEKDQEEFAKLILDAPSSPEEISTRKQASLIRLIDCIKGESQDVGKNVFGLMQGVTRYTTHEMKSKQESFGNVLGFKSWINQKAYNRCLEYVK